MLTRRLGPFSGTVRGMEARLSAVSCDLSDHPVSGPCRPHSFIWSAIIPFFIIILLSGCGGLAATSKSALVATPATIAFGNVTVGQSATAKITIQNQGLTAVEIEDLGVSGATFSIVGTTAFPITLTAGASITLELQFTPTASGSATEPLMITSDLSANPIAIANVTGTGTPGAAGGPKKVQLSWVAPASPNDIIIGYNVYRSTNGEGYQQLNSAIDQATSYTDDGVQSGSEYDYYVESVDGAGLNSPPSNSATISVP